MTALQEQLEQVIVEMTDIQRRIAADDQPASVRELDRLAALGRQYARIVEQLRHPEGGPD